MGTPLDLSVIYIQVSLHLIELAAVGLTIYHAVKTLERMMSHAAAKTCPMFNTVLQILWTICATGIVLIYVIARWGLFYTETDMNLLDDALACAVICVAASTGLEIMSIMNRHINKMECADAQGKTWNS